MSANGSDVFVVDRASNAVTEFSSMTGNLVGVIHGSSYEFDNPYPISSNGTSVWVVNTGTFVNPGCSGSVTQVSASTGELVRVIDAQSDDLSCSDAVTSDRTDVWVANWDEYFAPDSCPGWVTEFSASTGALARIIDGPSDDFSCPDGVTSNGTDVWVANLPNENGVGGNSVTEFSAATGSLIRVISGSSYKFNNPSAMASNGADVWVVNDTPNGSVTELSASTGAVVRVLSASSYEFVYPMSIALTGTDVWVSGEAVTEFSAVTGALIRVISGSSFGPGGPAGITTNGTDVWVAGSNGLSVTELSASTGAKVAVLSGPDYGFSCSRTIASSGSRVWVTNRCYQSLTEFPAS